MRRLLMISPLALTLAFAPVTWGEPGSEKCDSSAQAPQEGGSQGTSQGALLGGPAAGDATEARGEGLGRTQGRERHQVFMQAVRSLELTDEQKEQVRVIAAEFQTKMKAYREANKEAFAALKAERDAARESGDEQKLGELREKMRTLMQNGPKPREAAEQIMGLLTEEQKQQLQAKLEAARAEMGNGPRGPRGPRDPAGPEGESQGQGKQPQPGGQGLDL